MHVEVRVEVDVDVEVGVEVDVEVVVEVEVGVVVDAHVEADAHLDPAPARVAFLVASFMKSLSDLPASSIDFERTLPVS